MTIFDRWFRRRVAHGSTAQERGGQPPISYLDLAALFTFLNRPDPPACTHTHSETREFLGARGLAVDSTIAWLKQQGGGCDCEVIYNVADTWAERIGWDAEDIVG